MVLAYPTAEQSTRRRSAVFSWATDQPTPVARLFEEPAAPAEIGTFRRIVAALDVEDEQVFLQDMERVLGEGSIESLRSLLARWETYAEDEIELRGITHERITSPRHLVPVEDVPDLLAD